MTLAVLFDMFGPYHLARLNALGAVTPTVGLEVASQSGIYAWNRIEMKTSFERRTLFDVGDSSFVPGAEINRAVALELDRIVPEAVLVPGWMTPAAQAALRWCLEKGCPAVVMSESTRDDHSRKSWREAIKRQIVGRFGAGFVGGPRHSAYLEELGMPRSRIALGYNAVDNDYFIAGAERARANGLSLRDRLGLPKRYLLASARFIPIKNLLTLLEAFAAFRIQRPQSELSLVLLGDGEERCAIKAKCSELDLEQAVVLPGFQQYEALPSYYGLAEAFAHVSKIEPWGLVVNEATAASLPLVVSRECGCTETLVEHEVNGFVVAYNDVTAIATAFARLDADPELRARMGERSVEIVRHWGADRFASGAQEAVRLAKEAGPCRLDLTIRSILALLAR